ncbi:MAG: hypothetical protein A2X34_02730 [Elusimicrobia bacterium GWC2_51_8]|nr:MAG: hypothetical protein A2X33_03035 [Elusimicrobia bacterium GWA2_51_34]OGR58770.1 MAG: hypothetical protein A2X34_02730 [Elusimicrobia bacterium GWC2_51_8]HAF94989.1 hypothetical protein [Elusimicrobiota bacterium]HCE99097.1 hypothetical protein [Elusimicrobiota bacterium]
MPREAHLEHCERESCNCNFQVNVKISIMVKLSAIVLAAGASSRMGRPKALLEYRGKCFIENVCAALRSAGVEERIAVLGADAEAIASVWKPAGEKVIVNPQPDLGQLSSLRAGIEAASKESEGFMVCLADQPTIAPRTYKDIIAFWCENKDRIVIPRCVRPPHSSGGQLVRQRRSGGRPAAQSQVTGNRSHEQSQVTSHKSQATTPDSADSPLATDHSPLTTDHYPLPRKRGHPIIIPAIYRHLCFEGPQALGLHWVTHHPSVKVSDLDVEDREIIRDFDTPEQYEELRPRGLG